MGYTASCTALRREMKAGKRLFIHGDAFFGAAQRGAAFGGAVALAHPLVDSVHHADLSCRFVVLIRSQFGQTLITEGEAFIVKCEHTVLIRS